MIKTDDSLANQRETPRISCHIPISNAAMLLLAVHGDHVTLTMLQFVRYVVCMNIR